MAANQPVLEPLCFAALLESSHAENIVADSVSAPCLLCDEVFAVPEQVDSLFQHLLAEHSLIVDNAEHITDIPGYMNYWKKRFEGGLNLRHICTIISAENEDDLQFKFLLSEKNVEDKDLRSKLKGQKLEEVLTEQQKERTDDKFSRTCLFCMRHFTGNRSKLFEHMTEFHNFDVGNVDNLVYTSQLLLLLERKLHNLQCLYCEKTFKDGPVLKEHMRKKRHKRLRSSNKIYRYFYVSSYLGRTNENDIDEECDNNTDDDDDEDEDDDDTESAGSLLNDDNEWNDWTEPARLEAVCLFCRHVSSDGESLLQHLKDIHGFDLRHLTATYNLSFYQQVKLINFMRRQLYYKTCTYCEEKFENCEDLLQHMTDTKHISLLPPVDTWNQSQYYFPTYENDSLLCVLMDNDDKSAGAELQQVIAEDLPDVINDLSLRPSEHTATQQAS